MALIDMRRHTAQISHPVVVMSRTNRGMSPVVGSVSPDFSAYVSTSAATAEQNTGRRAISVAIRKPGSRWLVGGRQSGSSSLVKWCEALRSADSATGR